jgi:hypothetical protein
LLQCVRHDGFEDSARGEQRGFILSVFKGAATIAISLLEDRPEFGVVNKVEAVSGAALPTRRKLPVDDQFG